VLLAALGAMVPPGAWGPPTPAGPFNASSPTFNLPAGLVGDGAMAAAASNGASDQELYVTSPNPRVRRNVHHVADVVTGTC
jgi:hypothetical protein